MPNVELTKEIEQQLEDSKSKFHSPKYNISTSNEGAVEDAAKLFDIEKSTPMQPEQPPLELEEDYDMEYSTAATYKTYTGLTIMFIIIGVIIAWIKYPNAKIFNLIRGNRDRGKFIPVSRSEDV